MKRLQLTHCSKRCATGCAATSAGSAWWQKGGMGVSVGNAPTISPTVPRVGAHRMHTNHHWDGVAGTGAPPPVPTHCAMERSLAWQHSPTNFLHQWHVVRRGQAPLEWQSSHVPPGCLALLSRCWRFSAFRALLLATWAFAAASFLASSSGVAKAEAAGTEAPPPCAEPPCAWAASPEAPPPCATASLRARAAAAMALVVSSVKNPQQKKLCTACEPNRFCRMWRYCLLQREWNLCPPPRISDLIFSRFCLSFPSSSSSQTCSHNCKHLFTPAGVRSVMSNSRSYVQ